MGMPELHAAVPVLPVRDTAKAAAFYKERLGFQIIHIAAGYAVLARDRIEIHLWAANDESWQEREGAPVTSGAESFLAGSASARVLVTNVDVLFAEMTAADVVHPNGPLTDKPYGYREFATLDLDGNLITFFADIPTEAPKA